MVKPTHQRERRIAYLAVAVATLATFARSLGAKLLETWDDDRFLVTFDPVHSYSLENFWVIWREPHFQAWHPLHLMSYWLDVPWAGLNNVVIHTVSILLWCLVALAVLRMMMDLGLSPLPAALATLVYALHPVQVEVATWATGRKDILADGFAALAVIAHLRSNHWNDRGAWLTRAFYLAAALSKTTVLPLPGLLLLIDGLVRRVSWRRALLRQIPTVLLGLGLAVVVILIWDTNQMLRPDAAGNTVLGRVLLVMDSLTHHLRMAVLPYDSSPVYPVYRTDDLPLTVLIGPAVLAGAVILAWRRRAHRALLALLGFIVLALPVLNLLPMYWHYTDRYLSLPLMPLAFGFGAALAHLTSATSLNPGGRRLLVVAASLCVAALAVRTFVHQGVYQNDERLWRHATRVQPGSYYGWLKLAEQRRDAGDFAEALEAYDRAIEIAPRLHLAHAARMYTLLLRDEKQHGATRHDEWDLSWCIDNSPEALRDALIDRGRVLERWTPALEAVRCYQTSLSSATRLRTLATHLVRSDYRDAAQLTLATSFAILPVADERLEHAASVQHRRGNDWLARFYVRQMSRPPLDSALQELAR